MSRRRIEEVNVDEHAHARERRRSPRIITRARGTLRWPPPKSSNSVRVVDVAEEGLGLVVRGHPPCVGDEVDLVLEMEIPVRIHLGFAVDALIVDGPTQCYLVEVAARVARTDRCTSDRITRIGVEVLARCDEDARHVLRSFVSHLGADDVHVA